MKIDCPCDFLCIILPFSDKEIIARVIVQLWINCAITRIVLLLCIVHALVHTIVRISLLLPWLPVRFASVLVLHFDSRLNKRGRSFEVSALIIGVVLFFFCSKI